MRPIYLEFCAFGAYAKKQSVDFEKFNDKNIFVITGPTGAGKTTIFDAISYALFGTASGSSRDSKTCRSDYADETMDTYVELVFEVKGKRYKIRRNPEYSRKKLKGEGLMKVRDKVELTMDDGTVFTKKTDVSNEIKEILGIDKDQFRQIVMLPQGEFKKMLESSSEEKEKIFRKVFNTDKFNNIQEYLKNKSKNMYSEIRSMVEQRNTHVRNIECDEESELFMLINKEDIDVDKVLEETEKQIEEEKSKLSEIKNIIDKKKQEIIEINKEKVKAEEINKNLQQKEKLKNQKDDMESKIPVVKESEEKLKKSKRAFKVSVIEEKCNDSKHKLKSEENSIISIDKKITDTEVLLKNSEKRLKEEESKEEERVKLSNNISYLLKYVDRVKGYEEKKTEAVKMKNSILKMEKDKEEYAKEKKTLDDFIKKLELSNEEIQKAKVEKEVKQKQYKDAKSIIERLDECIQNINLREEKKVLHKSESEEYLKKQKMAEAQKHLYESMEENLRREQAGILALNLEEGTPCPVCGSTSHPHLAEINNDNLCNEDDIKREKSKFEKLDKEKNDKYNDVEKLNTEILMYNKQIEDLKAAINNKIKEAGYNLSLDDVIEAKGKMSEILNDIVHEGKKLKVITDREEKVKNDLKESREKSEVLQQMVEKNSKEYTDLVGKLSSFETEIKRIESDIPEELLSGREITEKINKEQNMLKEMKESLERARKNNSDLNLQYTSLKTSKDSISKNIESLKAEVKDLNDKMNSEILNQEFADYNDYKNSIIAEERAEELERRIRKFYEDMSSVNKLYEDISSKTEGLVLQDIDLFNEKIKSVTEEETELRNKEVFFASRRDNNVKAVDNIKSITSTISSKEKKYKVIAKVSNMAIGNNSNKISFERYVLAAYFDDVIRAANVRLDKLADGRFQLSRSEETLDGRKRKEGLEMDVYDYYTGKSRPVGTLSGGESFKASLALALGLSDVIQSYAGGVEMNTMFVDEGFGTLDENSLDNAVDCLLDLQSNGRLVGIISHVQSLKDRIETRIEVTKDSAGSSLELITN